MEVVVFDDEAVDLGGDPRGEGGVLGAAVEDYRAVGAVAAHEVRVLGGVEGEIDDGHSEHLPFLFCT